jgi:hypothetical protein
MGRRRVRTVERRLDGGDHALRLIVGRRRRLGRDETAVLDQGGVGERAADIDSEQK